MFGSEKNRRQGRASIKKHNVMLPDRSAHDGAVLITGKEPTGEETPTGKHTTATYELTL